MLVDMTARASRPGHQEVRRVGRDRAEEDQQHDRHDQGDEQALAAPQRQDELDAQLSQECAHSTSVLIEVTTCGRSVGSNSRLQKRFADRRGRAVGCRGRGAGHLVRELCARRRRVPRRRLEAGRAAAALGARAERDVTHDDLCDLEIAELAPLLRDRNLSPVELTDALSRAHRATRSAPEHATSECCPSRPARAAREAEARDRPRRLARPAARRAARHQGPVRRGRRAQHHGLEDPARQRPDQRRDRRRAARRQAGAVILGKQNLHEFAFGITSENPHYGVGAQPVGPRPRPGGSSGGTAAAVAAGLCAAGMGSDTGAPFARRPASAASSG